ncbi:MAG: hypothetical protein F2894_03385 [Actinobacteria bacterium]|nr:hypothetical protein [Actinomycetota bacterium]MSZ28724.1 hypothetical protein [Actinomycetota bacterium]
MPEISVNAALAIGALCEATSLFEQVAIKTGDAQPTKIDAPMTASTMDGTAILRIQALRMS